MDSTSNYVMIAPFYVLSNSNSPSSNDLTLQRDLVRFTGDKGKIAQLAFHIEKMPLKRRS
jgi:hypothetical protein